MVAMRTFEIVSAVVVAIIVFVVMELIGMLLKFAIIAALTGFIAGLALAWVLRRPG
jgi:membrane associated rhomboid family serine protease